MTASSKIKHETRGKINLGQTTISAAYITAALVVLFTAQLHNNLAFDVVLLLGSFIIFSLARAGQLMLNRRAKAGGFALIGLSIAVDLVAALTLLILGGTVVSVTTGLLIWLAGMTVVRVLALLKDAATPVKELRVATVFTLLATLAVFLVRADAIAAIGLFGAYTVVIGIFGMIAAFDHGRNAK
ncbi:hypothetical protein [Canibacter zhoujuaniae]|uniref:hypothetical protein n=1 Tax=Canibacter zhoujuaniae TaxID=2708343 RepID=UPI0014215502|nr:hypothetical protein [Canibacter zhoujuaniae]